MKIHINSIEIEYNDVSTLDSKERDLLPVRLWIKYACSSNGLKFSGDYKMDYTNEIHIPTIENYIKLELAKRLTE